VSSYAALARRLREDPSASDVERLVHELGARARMLRAIEFAQRGLWASARRDARDATELAPKDAFVQVLSGVVRYVTRDYQESLEAFDAGSRNGAPGAVRFKFERASRLSWYREAAESIAQGVALGGPERARWHAEGLALYARWRVYERALEHGLEAAELRPDVPTIPMELGNVHAELGDTEGVRRSVRAAIELKPNLLPYRMESARLLTMVGCFDEARAQLEAALELDPRWPAAHEALGSLALWAGSDDEAVYRGRMAVECEPAFAPGSRLLGACAFAKGDLAEARRRFDRAIELDAQDSEAHAFRAELALRAGKLEEAHQETSLAIASARGYLFAGQLLRLATNLRELPDLSLRADRVAHLRAGTERLCPELAPRLKGDQPAVWREAVDASLERMRANRSTIPTFLQGGRLELLRTGVDPRFDSRRALQTIRVGDPGATLAELEKVCERHSSSSLPPAHTGELLIWLGDLPGGRAALERALEITVGTRWAYIGLTTIEVLEGRPEQALRVCQRGVEAMHDTEGPAVHVARGEALRVLGRFDEARRDLERACALHPSRVSAWLNLGLLHAALQDSAGAEQIIERLKLQAPGLISDAAREEGISLFEDSPVTLDRATLERLLARMLSMCRANRSSTCVTYFTAAGQLRSVHNYPHTGTAPHARDEEELAHARTMLERALGIATRTPAVRDASQRPEPERRTLPTKNRGESAPERRVLSREQIASFVENGYLVLRDCIPKPFVAEWVADARRRIRSEPERWVKQHDPSNPERDVARFDLDDPSTWTLKRLDVIGNRNLPFADVSPLLWSAICELVGGESRVATRTLSNYFILNLRSEDTLESDDNWHIDDPPRPFRFDGLRNALVGIFLFSDVVEGGGPTLIAPESLPLIARMLSSSPEGLAWDEKSAGRVVKQCPRVVACTGNAGDVVLTHALMAHRASSNGSGRVRWLANPNIYSRAALGFSRDSQVQHSPVELAVVRALEAGRQPELHLEQ
jgi:tetratricopeptide (TPR) repeat protein